MTPFETILLAFGGNAALLVVLGFLGRSLIQTFLAKDMKRFEDSLTRNAKTFELELKAKADLEIERLKASFIRASRVHERQLEILSTLNSHFAEAKEAFQLMTSESTNEAERKEYERDVMKSMDAARGTFLQGRLFMPTTLALLCENVFKIVYEGRYSLARARVTIDPAERANLSNDAVNAAYEKLPKLLEGIDAAARAVMHGEQAV